MYTIQCGFFYSVIRSLYKYIMQEGVLNLYSDVCFVIILFIWIFMHRKYFFFRVMAILVLCVCVCLYIGISIASNAFHIHLNSSGIKNLILSNKQINRLIWRIIIIIIFFVYFANKKLYKLCMICLNWAKKSCWNFQQKDWYILNYYWLEHSCLQLVVFGSWEFFMWN